MCLSQNKETEKYLKSFGVRKIKNLGNLKFSKSKFISSNKLNKNILKMFQYKKYGVLQVLMMVKKFFAVKHILN